MARPTSLDDITAKRVVDAVAEGLPRVSAARLARIAPSTLYDWLRRGREGDPAYVEFSDRVKEAEAKAEQALVVVIKGHSANTWQAAAWLLERKWQNRWALKRRDPAKELTLSEAEAEALVAKAKAL